MCRTKNYANPGNPAVAGQGPGIAPAGPATNAAPSSGSGHLGRFAIAVAVVVVIIAVAAALYYVFFSNIGNPYGVLISNQSILSFGKTVAQGINSISALNASYSGTVTLSSSSFTISLPFNATIQKYGSDMKEQISISLSSLAGLNNGPQAPIGAPSQPLNLTLNLTLFQITGTEYVCAASMASSSAGCIEFTNATSSGSAAELNITAKLSSDIGKIIGQQVLSHSITSSSYNGNACTLFSESVNISINVSEFYSIVRSSAPPGSINSQVPSISTIPFGVSACLSDQYYGIPYSLNVTVSPFEVAMPSPVQSGGQGPNATMSASIRMNAHYINTEVSGKNITTLPYPVVQTVAAGSVQGGAAGMILLLLFGFGTLNSASTPTSTPTACIAQAGFECKITAFNGTEGLNATVGQATGQTWYNVKIAFLNQTQIAAPNTAAYWTGPNAVAPSSSTMYNGASYTITNAPYSGVTGTNPAIGTSATGELWAQYATSPGGVADNYTEVAVVTAKTT